MSRCGFSLAGYEFSGAVKSGCNQVGDKKSATVKVNVGDILLFRRATGICRVITWLTRSCYYHVGIYAGNAHVVECRPVGVVLRDLRQGKEGTVFAVIPAPAGKGQQAVKWAKYRLGTLYDPVGVLVILLERIFARLQIHYAPRNRYTCGQFVALAFEHAGVRLFPDLESTDVVPADFERMLPADARPASFAESPQ
jgi:hypothetical protein